MQTIKTGIVVALLLAVCYGAFVALNAPEPDLPPSIDEWIAETDEFQDLVGFENSEGVASLESTVSVSPEDFLSEMEGSGTSSLPDLGGANDLASENPSFPSLPGSDETPSLGMDLPSLDPTPTNLAQDVSSTEFPNSSATPESSSIPDAPSLTGFPALDAGGEAPSLSLPKMGADPSGSQTESAISQFPNLPGSSDATPSPSGSESLIPPMLDTGDSTSPYGLADQPGQVQTEQIQPGNLASTYDRSATQPESGLNLPAADFATARTQALQIANSDGLAEALRIMTPYFGSPELKYDEATDLIDILDGLAKEVVYSNRHLLEPAYVVKQNDTIDSVATAHGLTPEFLAAINGLGNSRALIAGNTLKVLEGPFRARVDLGRSELTLFLGDLYAGRFPISTGQEPRPKAGMFEVVDRQTSRTYYGNASNVLKHSDPRNPYGGYWIDIGEGLCIHGSAEMFSEDLANAGCISLAPIDARDIYNILISGSQVEIVE